MNHLCMKSKNIRYTSSKFCFYFFVNYSIITQFEKMCVISVGYSRKRNNVIPIVAHNINELKHRGYDSCGIATHNDCKKFVGSELNVDGILPSSVAISHARWATYGKISTRNTHPIKSGKYYIIHNGIIENYAELKNKYFENIEFESETDTEIIVLLFRKFVIELGIENTFLFLKNVLHGEYAFVIMNTEISELYYMCNGVPLIAFNDCENDIITLTSEVVNFPKNGNYMVMPNMSYGNVLDIVFVNTHEHKYVESVSFNTDYQIPNMLKEINEQVKLNNFYKERLKKMHSAIPLMLANTYIINVFGCGSSYNASLLSRHGCKRYSNNINIIDASCVNINNKMNVNKNGMIAVNIFVSQSGETKDIVRIARKTRKEYNICIVNKKESILTTLCNNVIYMEMGSEKSVPSTKSLMASYIILRFLLCDNELPTNIPSQVRYWNSNNELILLSRVIARHNHMFICGWDSVGDDIAREFALKMKETAYIHAEAVPLRSLKHGPFALLDPNYIVIVIYPRYEDSDDEINAVINEIEVREGTCITMGRNQNSTILNMAEWSMSELIIIAQFIAYHSAIEKKINPDYPRNIALD
jgi:glucosamine--fructose-6-phosphate aminotransferase (isomerizing)